MGAALLSIGPNMLSAVTQGYAADKKPYPIKGRKEEIDLSRFSYYITGFPRSGTLFYATFLTNGFSNCFHEPGYVFEKEDMRYVKPGDGMSCSSLLLHSDYLKDVDKPVIYLDIPFDQFRDSYSKISRFIDIVEGSGLSMSAFFSLVHGHKEKFIETCKNAVIVSKDDRFMTNTIEYVFHHVHRITLNHAVARQFSNSRIQLI